MSSSPKDDGRKQSRPASRQWRPPNTDAWEEASYWEAQQQYEKEQAEAEEAERREAGVEEMVTWFHEQFEDPQNGTPYDNEDGCFIYPWGGPFEAADVLHSAFGDEHPEAWINDAVEEVQKGDIYEWAPKTGGDYYDYPDQEDDPEELTRSGLAARILERLSDVERQLDELPSNLGHNRPPEEIGIPPYSKDDERELRSAIAASREEVTSPKPSALKLLEANSRLKRLSEKIAVWVGKKLDLAVDESIKYGVPLIAFSVFYGSLQKLVSDLDIFIRSLVDKF